MQAGELIKTIDPRTWKPDPELLKRALGLGASRERGKSR